LLNTTGKIKKELKPRSRHSDAVGANAFENLTAID
jgi:hypothetical protein